jgi:hypothetical protein
MTMILVVAAALALGASLRSRWTLLLPLAAGLAAAAAVAVTGNDLRDTPLPFLIAISTLALAAGKIARSRITSSVSRLH